MAGGDAIAIMRDWLARASARPFAIELQICAALGAGVALGILLMGGPPQ